MDSLIFSRAMNILDTCLSGDKRKLKAHLRDNYPKKYKLEMSSDTANELVKNYRDILEACNNLASKTFNNSSKPDFDDCIFSDYAELDENLKKKWIQGAYFGQFR
ncbi:hypothetical protein ACROAE_18495 [Shewanella sp. MF05960]|uniref:hypothetical protein n=1 Tax=Shewanella sp. MF05960 TaxID=3434874 RepID=UPI003D79A58D